MNPTPDEIQRFVDKIIRSDDESCWSYVGAIKSTGYGNFFLHGKYVSAHVFAHTIWNGPIPVGHEVRHTCHNRSCCNPAHLVTGTRQDNMNDMKEAGRTAIGGRRAHRKINKATALTIRLQHEGGENVLALAARYELSNQHLRRILNGQRWPERED